MALLSLMRVGHWLMDRLAEDLRLILLVAEAHPLLRIEVRNVFLFAVLYHFFVELCDAF